MTTDRLAPSAAARRDLRREGIDAAMAGDRARAQRLLARAVALDARDRDAWLWLGTVLDEYEARTYCLQRAQGRDPSPGREPLWLQVARAAAEASPATTPQSVARPTVRPDPVPSLLRQRLPRPVQVPVASAATGAAATTVERRSLSLAAPAFLQRAASWPAAPLFYLLAIALAELATAVLEPRLGMVAHCALLAGLLYHTFRVEGRRERAFLLTLAFAPLIRILSLSLPLARFPAMYWYLLTSLPLFAAAWVMARTLGYSAPGIGLRWGNLLPQLLIGVSGLAFGAVEYFILRPAALIPALEWRHAWWPALILLVSTGFLEELIFRGLQQRAAVDWLGRWGVVYVAAVFAVLHLGYNSALDVLFVFGVGLFLGWAVYRTRSLLGVTLAHGLTNIVLFLVMPFLAG
jgi:hypothetical protein